MEVKNQDEVQYYWIPHPDLVMSPAKVISNDFGIFKLESLDGKSQASIPETEVVLVHPSCMEGENNLLKLGDFNEFSSLHNIRIRYQKNQIYSQVGMPILISLNPYKQLSIYSREIMLKYKKQELSDPHLFQISEMSFQALFEQKINQSIIISGESGSGKTEATKIILKYLADDPNQIPSQNQNITVQKNKKKISVEEQVLDTNPLLETFGNAKTLRNDNSSRFGKFIQVFFSSHRKIHSAQLINYLLEKSRITQVSKNERSYHIFYQIFQLPKNQLSNLFLTSPSNYKYINDGYLTYNKDEEIHIQTTIACMQVLNITEQEQHNILQIVSAILQIGNLDFVNNQDEVAQTSPRSKVYLECICKLLQIKKEQLEELLLKKKMIVPNNKNVIFRPQSVFQANHNRDNLAKSIYTKLFDWLILKINQTLHKPYNQKSDGYLSEIGILDIFGFEIFDTNSFEQLNINFANEKLQQHFNQHMFKMEQNEYKTENIKWEHIQFVDNQKTIDLFENQVCIFSIIDDQCKMPKGNNEVILKQLCENIKQESFFKIESKFNRSKFGIKHFAGDVIYDVENFVDKNKDTNLEEFIPLTLSGNQVLSQLFSEEQDKLNQKLQREKYGYQKQNTQKKVNSVSFHFRQQLNTLLQKLQQSQPFYIRCIKPNNQKQPENLNSKDVLRQLKCAGLLEAIRIRKAGYAIRRNHLEFLKRYQSINGNINYNGNLKDECYKFMLAIHDKTIFKQQEYI